jgi:hypothetical protein
MNELLTRLGDAVREGGIPRPVPGESVDEFRLRAAHAGAVLAIAWYQEKITGPTWAVPVTPQGQHSDVTDDDVAVALGEGNPLDAFPESTYA